MWSRLRTTLLRLFRKTSTERALDDELRSYVEHDAVARMKRGVDPTEARREAMAEFGSLELVKELVREKRTGGWIDGLTRDFRYAARTLVESRTFSLSVIGSLSLGIAVSVVAFAFINALIFRPVAGIQRQSELVELRFIGGSNQLPGCEVVGQCWAPTSEKDFPALRDGMTLLQSLAASARTEIVAGFPQARSVRAMFVTEDYFDLLGVRPVLGRAFTREESEGPYGDVAIISHSTWMNDFGGDASVLEKSIRIRNRSIRIVGVAPREFTGLILGETTPPLWLPMALSREAARWGTSGLLGQYVGRRKPGTTSEAIQAQLNLVFSNLAAARNSSTPPPGRPEIQDFHGFELRFLMAGLIVFTAPVLVLGISCINAGNMLLGRAFVREREIAIRLAIGAPRWRVIRQLLIESFMLAIISALIAVPLAQWALIFVSNRMMIPMPLDTKVLGGALLTALICAITFGLTPAMLMTSVNPGRTLGTSAFGSGTPFQIRAFRRLVITQVALSLALLAVGTQSVATIRSLGGSAGVAPDHVLIAPFNLKQAQMTPEETDAFYQTVLERTSRLPQVEAAAIGPSPWQFNWSMSRGGDTAFELDLLTLWHPDGAPDSYRTTFGGYIDGDLFETAGVRVTEGRDFEDGDRQFSRPQVAIVNEAFVTRYLQGGALGKRIRVAPSRHVFGNKSEVEGYPSSVEVQVVGVVENVSEPRRERFGSQSWIYIPVPLYHDPARVLVVRSRVPTHDLSPAIARIVRETDGRVPVSDIGSLAEFNERALSGFFWLARGLAAFGFVALQLATFGLYAVMSHSVSHRSRELAIRLALGADGPGLLRMVLKQAMTLAFIGAVVGVILAIPVSLFIQSHNYAPIGIDGMTFAGSASLLIAAMLLASAIPAIRAARVDPIRSLRDM